MSRTGTSKHPSKGIEETPEFLAELQELNIELKTWDELAIGLYWHIDNNIDVFPKIDGTELRVAQTNDFVRNSNLIPALEIWFRISDDDSTIIVLGVTASDNEPFW